MHIASKIIAGGADYVPAVKTAKDEGVSVKLYHSGSLQNIGDRMLCKYSNELWDACNERAIINAKLINCCKLKGVI